VELYCELTGHIPNDFQEATIAHTVQPAMMDAWRGVVEHWLGHDWSRKNVNGMLQLLVAGGAPACTSCARPAAGSGNGRRSKRTEKPGYAAPMPPGPDDEAETERIRALLEAHRREHPEASW
jgi:hypothetical protein